ncbi:hypothetical protein DYU11_17420 [Fibrisoma montanum]|uniref:ATP-binding protein n=1 Tax=Fibrisoma montanum TaxID=2305895 RepID=A0A418M622_9BACT|nr:hypothetical protein [Fibrisoma montanum]RIV21205.1 hypothetical protein DYU11_17420 [Fibrisoma montanum]
MQKATRMEEIDAAVNKFEPVTPDHEFYVNFENLRGTFQERRVMRILNVTFRDGKYQFDYQANRYNKTLLYLAGMRGSGKTSELAKYCQLLDSPQCFFVVTCNVDTELDMNNIQYMDILIFQLEKLLQKAQEVDLSIDESILESMNIWFQERVKEINRNLKAEGSVELEVGNENPVSFSGLLGKLLGITAKLKAGLSGSYERAEAIRTNIKNRFSDFSVKFNTFIEQTNEQLRRENKGREILFIVDGLEKTMTAETRRAIILNESNRIRQIKANTIFTLPIELMKEEQLIRSSGEVVTFPFIKIEERDGSVVHNAIERFEEFVCKRVERSLFDSPETIHLAIRYSGGSPRQLLRIIEQATWELDNDATQITKEAVENAIEQMGNATARYIEPAEFELLKTIKSDLEAGNPIGFDSGIQSLLEKEIIFEYNDGTYKRVNPILERSKLYRYRVLGQA